MYPVCEGKKWGSNCSADEIENQTQENGKLDEN